MKKGANNLLGIALRYFILILAGFPSLWIFYFIFAPLTIYPVYFLLNLFFDSALIGGNSIIISGLPIEIIDACIAGSAYYLLLILNLATPEIKIKKRIYMISASFLVFLIVNILRIFFLSILYINKFALFDIVHHFFWYFMSIFFVVLIWFVEVKFFKIKKIPFYSDLVYVYHLSILKVKKKSKTFKKKD